jgi:hypothetical protein
MDLPVTRRAKAMLPAGYRSPGVAELTGAAPRA